MGAASYREDVLNRFFEATEALPLLGPLGPPRHHCPFCTETFDDRHALSAHLSSRHHGDRPVLLISGREPDGISTIRQFIRTDEISIENCSSARVRLNGIWMDDLSPSRVPSLLSRETDAVLEIELANRFDEVASPVYQPYRLTLRVPSKTSIDAVDRAFIDHLATGTPTMAQIAAFLGDSRCVGVVSDYADALGAFVRGLLVKDQAMGTGVTLPPSEGDDLYGSALRGLEEYQRPLPIVISGLVRFAFNDFSAIDRPTGFHRLDRCNAMLAPLVNRGVSVVSVTAEQMPGAVVKLCPFDQAVDRILDLADRLYRQTRWGPTLLEDCQQAAEAQAFASRDRVKVHALWAATALRLGADEAALEPLRRLRATYGFGKWAAEHLDRLET